MIGLFVKYRCITCNEICEFNSYKRFITKLNSVTGKYCIHCVQKYDEETKLWRHNMLKNVDLHKLVKGQLHFSKKQKQIKLSPIEIYNKFSEQEKQYYWEKHYTIDEFNKLIADFNITKINNIDINEIEYIPITHSNNQQYITSRIKYKNQLYSIKTITCKCKFCNNNFNIHWHKRDINKRIKNYAYCRQCQLKKSFFNKTWKIKSMNNLDGNKILYQSNYEKEFINFCNENNILIQNGPSLSYYWNNKEHQYFVDFYIPKLNIIIELKDMHRFHREQLVNGRWNAKECAAKLAVSQNKFSQFILLYKKDFTTEWKNNFKIRYNE